MPEVVLVTGVSRYLGGRFAQALSRDPSIRRIIGVDLVPPRHSIGRAEFVRTDIRNPMIGRIIANSDIDTVVHMNVVATPLSAGGRVPQKEINVIGTMQLLAACQKAPNVKRLVVKSSATVYGCGPRDPAMFTEDYGPKSMPTSGFGKDSVEVEGYVRGFARRRPGVDIALLRLANVIGPGIRTSFTDYFSLPVLPMPLGSDARLQFLHEDDAIRAMVTATTGPPAGIVNVAGDGVITVTQAAAIVGRPVISVPFGASLVGLFIRRVGLADFNADQLAFLGYGRGLDTTRMRQILNFEPAYTTRQAFQDFADHVPGLIPGSARAVAAAENVVYGALSGAGMVAEKARSVMGAAS